MGNSLPIITVLTKTMFFRFKMYLPFIKFRPMGNKVAHPTFLGKRTIFATQDGPTSYQIMKPKAKLS